MQIFDNRRYLDSLTGAISGNGDILRLSGKSLLITGATGMIGSCLVDMLICYNRINKENKCRIYAMNRNSLAAKKRFEYCNEEDCVYFIEGDVSEDLPELPEKTDFIIHAASNADPVRMALYPVNTLLANVNGTKNLIEYGMAHGMERFLYVSSGEMYGQPDEQLSDFTEDYCGPINHAVPRACYPAGKRAAEVLCQSYISQYGIDAVIVRPCHIFGPTMKLTDSRALAEFFRNAVNGERIQLKSAGLLERSHCYSIDAVNAMLYVLLRGKSGEAYNIADRNNQMRIRDFAQILSEIAGTELCFVSPNDVEAKGYSASSRMVLSEDKLQALGWTPLFCGNKSIEDTYFILKEIS